MTFTGIIMVSIVAWLLWQRQQHREKEADRYAEDRALEGLMIGQGLDPYNDVLLREVQKKWTYSPINKYLTEEEIQQHTGRRYDMHGNKYTELLDLLKKRRDDEDEHRRQFNKQFGVN